MTGWRSHRRVALTLVLVLVVLTAGCSELAQSDGTVGETDSSTPNVENDSATSSTAAQSPDGDADEAPPGDRNDSNSHVGENADAGDGGHTHGEETAEVGPASNARDQNATLSGKLTVVVGGSELALDEVDASDEVWIDANDGHTWHAADELTLSAALDSFGVDASEDSLSYDGTTYRASTDGTAINVRVNGEAVDPERYTLSDGDEVWVTVETAGMDVAIPGTYIKAAQQHIHGPMTVVVEGEGLDFAEDRYQSGHRYFHFEGGHSNPWHAHSWSVTLEYAITSLDGLELTEDGLTYDGTTYRDADSDTRVTVEVNGEAVDPGAYFLKDGDSIRIVVETDTGA
ncbi:MAG: hypothetical protein ACQETI_06530 [Halobacteriota archaeon]